MESIITILWRLNAQEQRVIKDYYSYTTKKESLFKRSVRYLRADLPTSSASHLPIHVLNFGLLALRTDPTLNTAIPV